MDSIKSLDETSLIVNVLRDVSNCHGSQFCTAACDATISKLRSRVDAEGLGFLTKTMPSLGKALDCALSGGSPLNSVDHGFEAAEGRITPRFLGEFFERVLTDAGTPLTPGCEISVKVLRQVLYLFYKYELPYTDDLEQHVLTQFERTETELIESDAQLALVSKWMEFSVDSPVRRLTAPTLVKVIRRARKSLARLFARFDPLDITPSHGPGAVSQKETAWEKYEFNVVPTRLTDVYPFDQYFCAGAGHVCDEHRRWSSIDDVTEIPARVILVPKDSRGPRLISCEPTAMQWIQQGQRKAIYKLVETHPLTAEHVFFTNQVPNQVRALQGSNPGMYGLSEGYATLDLKEASDRVSLELVRLLFPAHVCSALEASRSRSTRMPDGRVIPLRKFAPMGSALCFPIMALTIWSLLDAYAVDADTRESILVYGDDVIVREQYAPYAIQVLEAVGLRVNRQKSCTKGPFRESCGMDAYQGICVTPVRLRTVWTEAPTASAFESWVAYANSFHRMRFYSTYEYIAGALTSKYWPIAWKGLRIAAPFLEEEPNQRVVPSRWNKRLQKRQYLVTVTTPSNVRRRLRGWQMLLRYLTSSAAQAPAERLTLIDMGYNDGLGDIDRPPFSVSLYTERRSGMLERRWR